MAKKHFSNKTKNRGKSKEDMREKPSHDQVLLSPLIFDLSSYNHAEFASSLGEKKLLQGDIRGLQFFDIANTLEPENHTRLYEQGLALFEYGSETKTKKYLLLANKKFKKAVKMHSEFFEAWQAWGNTLLFLGETFLEHHFFLEAKQKYESALLYIQGKSSDTVSELYWDYGKVLKEIQNRSKEVSDLNCALEAFAKASSIHEDLPTSFWHDFGVVSLELGIQMNDIRLHMKAVNCFKMGISKSVSNYENWFELSLALYHLYQITHDEDHFCQSNECFANAAKLHPQNEKLWKAWARLLLYSGVRLKDSKRLHSCMEKCHRSYSCNRKDNEILVLWSEALSHLGLISDRLDLILEGANKITEAIEHFDLFPEICYAHGINLFVTAQYYNDIDYYYQAIEKFQEGLSINRTEHKLWFNLGVTYSILGTLENDPSLFERASKFFLKGIDLKQESTYFYHYALNLSKSAETQKDLGLLENAIQNFEQAFLLQKNAVYLHPEWLFQYAMSLDLLGDFSDDEKHYIKSIEILKRVLMLDPDFPDIHYKIALVYSHLGELLEAHEVYAWAISHYKIAHQSGDENDHLLLDWALTLINLSQITYSSDERELLWKEAEYKLVQSAKLGNSEAYYHLACLYSLMNYYEKAMLFLEKAELYEALPPIDEVLEDEWLDNLRQTEIFKTFINRPLA